MEQYSILIVDGSAVMRRTITKFFESDARFVVVGIARTGLEAEKKIVSLNPDIVILNSEITDFDGFVTLRRLMNNNKLQKAVIVSAENEEDAKVLKALEYGATTIILKKNIVGDTSIADRKAEFISKIEAIIRNIKKTGTNFKEENEEKEKNKDRQIELVFIGTSTGGPSALQAILPRFPKDFPVPIIVDQHMPLGFTQSLAARFKSLCQLDVKEAENNEVLQAGIIYIAPSGFQTTLQMVHGNPTLKVWNHKSSDVLYKPCIDITLTSLAPIYGSHLLAIILTGMGSDGLEGCKLVKNFRGHVIIEAEQSCVVYGMPKAIFESGFYDKQVPLSDIYKQIRSYV
ncbi:MAG TPA: chemotaxis-specific protein-glutamate methyltransferase CheB [Bacillus bacterium]|nr:chemotaxis-specific protein-glutamate methyltransferase CheB [Bacillus sp. (in: firmicutes)]